MELATQAGMTIHSVASHLEIPVAEYDARIRTFVPHYEEMVGKVEELVGLVAGETAFMIDLGIGTGALAAGCLNARPDARILGVDADAEMLAVARGRLREHANVSFLEGNFLELELPAADVIVASLSLHHVATAAAKRVLYQKCRRTLQTGGSLIIADCYLPLSPKLVRRGMASWRRHLQAHYGAEEAARYLAAWSEEDTYFPLADELGWLRSSGFEPDVVWRNDLFAVLHCAVTQ